MLFNNLLLATCLSEVNKTNHYGCTPLMVAASEGDNSKVAKLLEANADVNLVNRSGVTALMIAVQEGYGDICPTWQDERTGS